LAIIVESFFFLC